MSDPELDRAASRWLNDGTKRIPELGDGDPREYGGILPDGRRWSHPPYGPARIDRPNPFRGPSMDDLRRAGAEAHIQRLRDNLQASMRSTRRGRLVWWLSLRWVTLRRLLRRWSR